MRYYNLYLLRFFAAYIVVMFHFYKMDEFKYSNVILKLIHNYGNDMVTFFYVLSGFILYLIYFKDEKSIPEFKKFLVNRISRIYPLYVLAFLFVLMYDLLISKSHTNFFLRSLFEISLTQSWINKLSINFPGWSLSTEFFFYTIFLFIANWVFKTKKSIFLIVTLIYLIIFFINFSFFRGFFKNFYFSPYLHLFPFLIGIFGGKIFMFNQKNNIIKLFMLNLIILLILLIYSSLITNYNIGLFSAFYLLVILLASTKLMSISNKSINKIFLLLGDSSYGVYILQYPIYLFYIYFVGIDKLNTFHFGIYSLVLILFSILLYIIYEKPSMLLIRNCNKKIVNNKF